VNIEDNYGCNVPGTALPHMTHGHPHDWRLWERKWYRDGGWQETWYCTKCRKIEERMGT
jgi:hypothetical protein